MKWGLVPNVFKHCFGYVLKKIGKEEMIVNRLVDRVDKQLALNNDQTNIDLTN